MAAYVVVESRVSDPERYKAYAALAEQSIAEAGGRYLARGGATETLEGDWAPPRVVVLEFADVDTARRWYESESYRAARAARAGAAELQMVLVEGVPPS
ncbi:MAG TPA: DUF1330 domain-containing protein [Acidimicrobiales bacterium]|nr:DUF1330 domain-containing protein [Acidimicrobiales bacterium]